MKNKDKLIKEKLKVLEILRNKQVNINYLCKLYYWYEFHGFNRCISYTLEIYNDNLEFTRQLTKEELFKIIKWLENSKIYEE